jgi:tetratricopeptide (TPR) repeat protein
LKKPTFDLNSLILPVINRFAIILSAEKYTNNKISTFPMKEINISRSFTSKFIILIVFTGVMFFQGGCATTPDSEDARTKAKKKFNDSLMDASLGMRDKQIANLKEAIQLTPENLNYRFALGLVYSLIGEIDHADQEFKNILAIDPNYKPALRELGRAYLNKREWTKAAKSFEGVLKEISGVSNPHQVYNWLALSYYKQGKLVDAERVWLKALKISENAGVRYNLALSYKEQERFDLARDSLEKAVKLKPDFAQALFELAQLELKNKNPYKSIRYFKKVKTLAPNSRLADSAQEYLNLIRPIN